MRGLLDSDIHPGMVGVSTDLPEMDIVQAKETLIQNKTDVVAANPDREVRMGGYWDNGVFGEEGPHRRNIASLSAGRQPRS